jgi:hypothetical protein
MTSLLPRAASLAFIHSVEAIASQHDGGQILRAGTPLASHPPNGLADIMQRGGQASLGVSGGLTLTKSVAAFTAPAFVTATRHQRSGNQVEHYAMVQATQSMDATHESCYPTAGHHLRPLMLQKIGRRTFNHYWDVSASISALIRDGEQEHLDDARRAYEITYKRVEDAINALAGQQFGPASTPAAATALAEQALARSLPPQLGTNPATWASTLDRLLKQTNMRDTNGWHTLDIGPPQTRGNMILHPVTPTSRTRIGQVPSSQVVNL